MCPGEVMQLRLSLQGSLWPWEHRKLSFYLRADLSALKMSQVNSLHQYEMGDLSRWATREHESFHEVEEEAAALKQGTESHIIPQVKLGGCFRAQGNWGGRWEISSRAKPGGVSFPEGTHTTGKSVATRNSWKQGSSHISGTGRWGNIPREGRGLGLQGQRRTRRVCSRYRKESCSSFPIFSVKSTTWQLPVGFSKWGQGCFYICISGVCGQERFPSSWHRGGTDLPRGQGPEGWGGEQGAADRRRQSEGGRGPVWVGGVKSL